MTNDEWMTVARNIENVASNWSGGSVGLGSINWGHTDNSPANSLAANSDDTQACEGTEQTCSDTVWSTQRRTHVLSNGEVIWDFSGNVGDWIDWTVVTDKASPQFAAIEINTTTPTTAMPQASYFPENASYDSSHGIGRYYPGEDGSGGIAFRGGYWLDSGYAGVFALSLNSSSWSMSNGIGFRCAWSPGG